MSRPVGLGTVVPIDLDKPRTIRLTLWAMREAEQALSKEYGRKVSILALFTRGELSYTDVLALLWAGLKHEDKKLTMEQVGELIDMRQFRMAEKKLVEAWTDAMGPQEEDHAPEPGAEDPPLASTGEPSGASDAPPSPSAMPSSGA
jgi:hypothetical protein